MKIIFAGTPEFALPALKALINSSHKICAIYTQPDRPAGRGQKLTASPVKQFALAHNLPIYQPSTLKDSEAQKQLDDLNKAIRDNIVNNPASKAVQQKMCDERKKLFTAIESILDASQLTKWKDAIAKFPDPCK